MTTAVQLRPQTSPTTVCELLCGNAAYMLTGTVGPIAVFRPGALVAYLVQSGPSRRRLFVFRTLVDASDADTLVPGVEPRVDLLLEVTSAGRIEKLRRLFAYLEQRGHDPCSLSNAFYLRVGAALGGKLPATKIIRSLLEYENGARSF